MTSKILIFRTDRIGDLIFTCPTIISIKKYFNESDITLITSEKNYQYAKSLNIFSKIIQFPRNNLKNKVKFLYKLYKEKYDYIFIFDGKERSIISSAFLQSKYKVALTQKIKFYYKFFKIKFFEDSENTSLNDLFQKMINHVDVNIKITNYDFVKNKNDNNFSKKISIDKYVHIHLDEKWYNNLYIDSYTNINPDYLNFVEFINYISKKKDILITTGLINTQLITELKAKFFNECDKNIFHRNNFNHSIYFIYKPSFEDIESLLRKSQVLISCHGAITHAANSFDIVKIDILEENKIKFYKRFTSSFKNYFPIYRSNFINLKENLLSVLNK